MAVADLVRPLTPVSRSTRYKRLPIPLADTALLPPLTMKVPFASSDEKSADVAYEKMKNENEHNEQVQDKEQGLVATLVNKKVEKCCLNPKKCCLVQNPVSQKVIEVVKSRLN